MQSLNVSPKLQKPTVVSIEDVAGSVLDNSFVDALLSGVVEHSIQRETPRDSYRIARYLQVCAHAENIYCLCWIVGIEFSVLVS